MERLKRAAAQAAAVLVIGCAIAFAHNALSVNGIDPFRKIPNVRVIADGGGGAAGEIRVIGLDRMREIVGARGAIIDARTEDEYREGHIPGARLLDYYRMGRYLGEVLPHFTKEQEIVIYCTGPDCEDSELLARELYALGYGNLLLFKGGFEEWREVGLPVETGDDDP